MMFRTPLAGLVLALLAFSAEAFPGRAAAPLPEGRLMGLSGNRHGASFVALDQSSRRGPLVDAWVMRIFAEPVVLSAPDDKTRVEVVQSFTHWALDCTGRTARRISDDGFDASGKWLIADIVPQKPEPPTAIEPSSVADFLAKFFCDGQKPPQMMTVTGHAAALDLIHRIKQHPPG
jgi:hypothetical protein